MAEIIGREYRSIYAGFLLTFAIFGLTLTVIGAVIGPLAAGAVLASSLSWQLVYRGIGGFAFPFLMALISEEFGITARFLFFTALGVLIILASAGMRHRVNVLDSRSGKRHS